MTQQVTEVDFGPMRVAVPKGGYYDRFHLNPDLDEVARDPAAGNVDFFRRFPKQQMPSRVGPIWAPNFYYRSRSAQVLLLAPLDRLRAMLPEPLQPLRALPGHGVVALTFLHYAVCDNDPYHEVSVAVVIRKPGARGSQALELRGAMRRRSFHAHVLALPVDTEIARIRGVHGYQLPKWRAQIDLQIKAEVQASIKAADGAPDLVLTAPMPVLRHLPSQSHIATSTMIHRVDGRWHQTAVQANMLSFAQQLLPRGVVLTRGGGPLSQLLDGLGAGRILRFDVVKDAQLVLNLPIPLA